MMQKLSETAERWYISSKCPFIRAAYLDVVSMCGLALLRRSEAMSILYAWTEITTSVSLGPDYALEVSDSSGAALLRQSLAQVFFIDRVILRDDNLALLVSKDYQTIGDALLLLATKDPDTCCTALDTLEKVLQIRTSSTITIPHDLLLSHIHRLLLSASSSEVLTTPSPEVFSKAQFLLANNLTPSPLSTSFFALLTSQQILSTLSHLSSQALSAPPSNTHSALHLLGPFLDHAYASRGHTILPAIAQYIHLLRATIVDTQPFDTRFAAASSLCALRHIWLIDPTSKHAGEIILSLAFLLYDVLNDDDDEIRSCAALATSHLLHSSPTVPILASYHLAAYLLSTFRSSPILVREAVRRLTSSASGSEPFEIQLRDAMKQDTSLFATEKQNLYLDPVLDAHFFSHILTHTSPHIPASIKSSLRDWVLSALSTLTRTASEQDDGALGWTSKPDVFALVMRVVCAAEAVLDGEVMLALKGFVDVGVHGLVVERVEGVLERGVVGIVRGFTGGLNGMLEE